MGKSVDPSKSEDAKKDTPKILENFLQINEEVPAALVEKLKNQAWEYPAVRLGVKSRLEVDIFSGNPRFCVWRFDFLGKKILGRRESADARSRSM